MTTPSKRLIIHIGFHKTGTSALQEALFTNAERAAAGGLIYPKPLCRFKSHLDMAAALFPDELPWVNDPFEFDATYDYYAQVVADAPAGSTIVVSTEELCRVDQRIPLAEKIHGKLGALPDTQTQIVAYVRDPVGFLLSLYHHQIRQAVYDDTFHAFTHGGFNINNARFENRLAGWRQVFGEENVVAYDYDAALSTYGPGGITRDFITQLGYGDLTLEEPDRMVNTGIHPWFTEAYRAISHTEMEGEEREKLQWRVRQLGKQMPRVDAAAYYLGAEGLAELRAELA